LNSTLGTFSAIDRQYKAGIPVAAAVSQATKEINSGILDIKKEVIEGMLERFSEMQVQNQAEATQLRGIIREVVTQQTQDVMNQVKVLQEQGRSLAEIQGLLKDTVGSVQTVMTALQIPTVKGEEGEVNVFRDLQDAFLGQHCIKIEPISGADATDALVRFYRGDIEIGRSLVEVKSRKTWSNEYVEQVRQDMKRYSAPLAVLAVDKLPKTAKARGFHIDMEVGVLITTSPEMVVPTFTMFYEIYSACYKLGKQTLNLEAVAADRDLSFYINDNMKILEDCKKISDVADDSVRKIKEHVASITSRLLENNRKIAQRLSKFSSCTWDGKEK
jgi:DNA-binding transcriptional MerR regulator